MRLLVGVDIGTQGTKAALFAEDGACLAEAFQSSELHRPRPGVVEENPERQFQSVCRTIRQCVRKASIDGTAVAGIGIDGQMAGVIGIGSDGRAVTPYDSWLDTRCAPYIERMEQEAGEEIVRKTGGPPSFNHGPKILWWQREHPGVYRTIVSFVQPGGYAVMRACGLGSARAFIDRTYLHFSGFADNQHLQWDSSLCRQFGVEEAKLPRIVTPDQIVGELTSGTARRCGLKPGVPVVAGCGDTAASFLACGATAPGIGVDVAGTASVFAMTTSTFRPDYQQRMLACGQSAVSGLWHPYAYINGGGLNVEWFLREIVNRGHTKNDALITLGELEKQADIIPASADLPLFVPHLGGRVSPAQPNLRGAWTELSWSHTLPALYRALLEGVALEYAVYQEGLRDLYPDLKWKELRLTGGGAHSTLWTAIKADALQLPIRRVARGEGAPLGAALLAGYGVGVFKSLPDAARQWISLEKATLPRRSLKPLYAQRLARYQDLLHSLDRL